ncbi:hypothetical protein [Jiella mangrovi]|uniref:Uncharacterized protein n=1 Tax=Jiella mangrovi TaxID=2821407 RepID=A0ABS4BJI6_9HYPH|nr:hypothetical protein [Jiella mangrovi]MBP0616900.1 hypothetical protein [Jiella mangrovi]
MAGHRNRAALFAAQAMPPGPQNGDKPAELEVGFEALLEVSTIKTIVHNHG